MRRSPDLLANLIVTSQFESVHDREICDIPRQQDVPQSRMEQGGHRQPPKTGKLPEWNLSDLYSGIDAPEIVRDLQSMDADCVAFETDYKGKLADIRKG